MPFKTICPQYLQTELKRSFNSPGMRSARLVNAVTLAVDNFHEKAKEYTDEELHFETLFSDVSPSRVSFALYCNGDWVQNLVYLRRLGQAFTADALGRPQLQDALCVQLGYRIRNALEHLEVHTL